MSIKKINIGKGKKYAFEQHINEFLIYREDAKLSEVFTVVVPIKSQHMIKYMKIWNRFLLFYKEKE